jgi:hypothetical protein
LPNFVFLYVHGHGTSLTISTGEDVPMATGKKAAFNTGEVHGDATRRIEENEDGYKLTLLHLSSRLKVKTVLDILTATATRDLFKKKNPLSIQTQGVIPRR